MIFSNLHKIFYLNKININSVLLMWRILLILQNKLPK